MIYFIFRDNNVYQQLKNQSEKVLLLFQMKNQSLKKRLYQQVLAKSDKSGYILQGEPKSLLQPLRPRIVQDNKESSQKSPHMSFQNGKVWLSPSPKQQERKKVKPVEVEKSKLSEEAKTVIENGKKMKGKDKKEKRLNPHDIFGFYEQFPEMRKDFFYLNRMSHPYDYIVVPYSERNTNYMTISSHGITLYHDKEIEFTTMEQWVHDQKIYHNLQKVKFFSQYKISKNFLIWKNRMKRHYMKEMSNVLEERLFLTNLHPRKCLLEVKKITNSIQERLSFMSNDISGPETPENLLKEVAKFQKNSFIGNLNSFQSDIILNLEKAINEEIQKFKTDNNIKIDGLDTNQREGRIYSQQAILRKQYKRVVKLIKLADYNLMETKIQLVKKCLEELNERLINIHIGEVKEEWIICKAYPNTNTEQKIRWEPNLEELQGTFETIIESAVKSLDANFLRIIDHPNFLKYKSADEMETKKQDKSRSLREIIVGSDDYKQLVNQIKETLAKEFQKTKSQEKQLFKFMDTYTKHTTCDIQQVFTRSVAELAECIRQWNQDNIEMQQLSESKSCGLLLFDYKLLRQKMINAPKQSIQAFKNKLPLQINRRCEEISAQTKQLLQSINIHPTDINLFVEHTKAVKIAAEKQEALSDQNKQLSQLLALMIEQNKMTNIDTIKQKVKKVNNGMNSLKEKVNDANIKFQQNFKIFRKGLEGNISKIKESVKSISVRFSEIQYDKLSHQPSEMLEHIKKFLPSIKSLYDQSRNIQEIENELTQLNSDFKDVEALYMNANQVYQLWNCRKQWNENCTELNKRHFLAIDSDDLLQKWKKFSSESSKLLRELPENQVAKKLSSEISEFQSLCMIIVALQNKNLGPKSWKQISEYLAYELGIEQQTEHPFLNINNPKYTVQWLVDNKITLYRQKLQFVSKKCGKEKDYEKRLRELSELLKDLACTLSNPANIKKKEIILLENSQELNQCIRNNVDQLQSMLGTQFSSGIQKDIQRTIRQYQYLEQIIAAIKYFGKNWELMDKIFDPNSSSSKLLVKESKDFSNWQFQWKSKLKPVLTENFSKKIQDETSSLNPSRHTFNSLPKKNQPVFQQIKKGIDDFLEKKRSAYSKYYFYSDQQLLNIFSIPTDSEQISPQIIELLYDNIQKVVFENDSIVAIITKTKETITMKQVTFKSQSEPQQILKILDDQIKRTINSLIKSTLMKYSDEQIKREQMIKNSIMQVALAVDHIAWVSLAEQTYLCNEPIGDFYDWLQIQESQIKQLAELLKKNELSPIEIAKGQIMMCQSIYLREKTQELLKNNVKDVQSYEWERVLKLCLSTSNPVSQIFLKQLSHRVNYCSQFLGNNILTFITPQTQRNWLNIIHALSNKDPIRMVSSNHTSSKIQTVSQLAYVLGQKCRHFHINDSINFRTFQRFLTGICLNGNWMIINEPANAQIMSQIANQIILLRKSLTGDNGNGLQTTKLSMNINSNTAIFLNSINCNMKIQEGVFYDREMFRMIHFEQPNICQILSMIAECQGYTAQVGVKIAKMIRNVEELLNGEQLFYNDQFGLQIGKKIYERYQSALMKKNNADKKYDKALLVQCFKIQVQPRITDKNLQNFRTLISSNSELKKGFASKNKIQDTIESQQFEQLYDQTLQQLNSQFLNTEQFKRNAKILYENLIVSPPNRPIIVCGPHLSGKTKLIEFVFKMSKDNNKKKHNKIYHNAYSHENLYGNQIGNLQNLPIATGCAVDRLINPSNDILSQCLGDSEAGALIHFDGFLSKNYKTMMGQEMDKLILQNSQQISINSVYDKNRFILQTWSLNEVDPSFCNNFLMCIKSQTCTIESIISSYMCRIKQNSSNLSAQSLSYLKTQLSAGINRLTNYTNPVVKNKAVEFIYGASINDMAHRCMRLVEAIFILNKQTITDKDKQMKRIIDRFVIWVIVWSIGCLVSERGQQQDGKTSNFNKFQNMVIEGFKCQTLFSTVSLRKYCVYWNNGLEIQQIGYNRASPLHNIPQEGIVTNVLLSEHKLLNSNNTAHGNSKFYEEVCLEQLMSVRVNTEQSIIYSYFLQLYTSVKTPLLLMGEHGSGKKSIVELHVKNTSSSTQYHSIRIKKDDKYGLLEKIERPCRKFTAINGPTLKSLNPSHKLLIFVEDIHLGSESHSQIEILRMLITDWKIHHPRTHELNYFSPCALTLTSTRIHDFDTVSSLLSRCSILQISEIDRSKIQSIYSPILKTWSQAFNFADDLSRLFINGSSKGMSIVDAIFNIYTDMNQLYESYSINTMNHPDKIKKILAKPNIGDVGRILTNIIKTEDPASRSLSYYAEIWAHEVLRVFGDRIENLKDPFDNLVKKIKKEALLKFKQNFSFTFNNDFIFTNLSVPGQTYERIQNPMGELYAHIDTLLENEQLTLPLYTLFPELLAQIFRIYRILVSDQGHMLLIAPNHLLRAYLVQISAQIASNKYFYLANGVDHDLITVQKHIMDSIIKQYITCMHLDLSVISSPQKMYQIQCIINKNNYKCEMTDEVKKKIKKQLYHKYNNKEDNVKQPLTNNNSMIAKTNNKNNKKDTTSNITLNNKILNEHKIQDELENIILQKFINSTHFIFTAQPYASSTCNFLQNYPSITKHLHYSQYYMPNQALYKVGLDIMIEDYVENGEEKANGEVKPNAEGKVNCEKLTKEQVGKICSRVMQIFQSEKDSDFNNFFCMTTNVIFDYGDKMNALKGKVKIIEETINKRKQVDEAIKKQTAQKQMIIGTLSSNKKQIQQLSAQQQQNSNKVSKLLASQSSSEEKSTEIERQIDELNKVVSQAETKIKELKIQRENLEQQKKNSIKLISMSTQSLQFLKEQSELLAKLQTIQQQINSLLDKVVITWAILIYLGKQKIQNCPHKVSKWLVSLGLQDTYKCQSVSDIINIMSAVIPQMQCTKIDGWERFPQELILKGIIICYNLILYENSIFSQRLMKICDPDNMVARMLKSLSQSISYNDCKLMGQFDLSNLGEIQKQFNKAKVAVGEGEKQAKVKSGSGIALVHNVFNSSNNTEPMTIHEELLKHISVKKKAKFSRIILVSHQGVEFVNTYDILIQCPKEYARTSLILTSINQERTELISQLKSLRKDYTKSYHKIKQLEEQSLILSSKLNITNQQNISQLMKIKRNLHDLKENLVKIESDLKSQHWNLNSRGLIDILTCLFSELRCIPNHSTDIKILKEIFFQFSKQERILKEIENQTKQTSNRANLYYRILKLIRINLLGDLPIEISNNILVKLKNVAFEQLQQGPNPLEELVDLYKYTKLQLGEVLNSLKTWGNKLPIIIVQNNSQNSATLNEMGKGLFKFYNILNQNVIQNLLIEQAEGGENSSKTNTNLPLNIIRVFQNYNTKIHLQNIQCLIQKYVNQFKDTGKINTIIIVTNEINAQNDFLFIHNYRLINIMATKKLSEIYQQKTDYDESNEVKRFIADFYKIFMTMSDHQRKRSQYLRRDQNKEQYLNGEETSKSNNTDYLFENCELLKSKVQASLMLKDYFTQKWHPIINRLSESDETQKQQILEQLRQISINYCSVGKKEIFLRLKNDPEGQYQVRENISVEEIRQLIQQLPYAFKFSEMNITNDLLSSHVLSLCTSYNQRLTTIKKHLNIINYNIQNISPSSLLPLIPTEKYLIKLNKQQNVLKKALGSLGIINSLSQSVVNIKPNPSQVNKNNSQQINTQTVALTNLINNATNLGVLGYTLQVHKFVQLRFSRKLKLNMDQVNLGWKLYSANLVNDQNFLQISNQTMILVTGELFGYRNLVVEQTKDKFTEDGWNEIATKVKLIVIPVDIPSTQKKVQTIKKKEIKEKDTVLMMKVAIKDKNCNLLGYVQIPIKGTNDAMESTDRPEIYV